MIRRFLDLIRIPRRRDLVRPRRSEAERAEGFARLIQRRQRRNQHRNKD